MDTLAFIQGLGAADTLAPCGSSVRVDLSASAAGAPSVGELLDLLEVEERRERHRRFSTRLTTLRKIFYSGTGWNVLLIPGTAWAPSHYRAASLPGSDGLPPTLDLPDGEPLALNRGLKTVVDADGVTPRVFGCQEAALPAGALCDVGHVLCGLDAANHPAPVGVPGLVGTIERNIDAVTWAGDLGSWLAEVQIAATNGDTVTPQVVDRLRDVLAPGQDMLGNLDPFALRDWFHGVLPGDRVVQRLRGFYLDHDGVGAALRRWRFREAALGLGLGPLDGDRFRHQAAFVARAAPDVASAAALYFLTTVRNPGSARAVAFATGLARNGGADVLVKAFVRSLAEAVRNEAGYDPHAART